MAKAELVLQIGPNAEPLVRGYCSACPDVLFTFVNSPDSQEKIQHAFDRHYDEIHATQAKTKSASEFP